MGSIPEFQSSTEIEIAERFLKFPRLDERIPEKWHLDLVQELHMSNDSDLFERQPNGTSAPLVQGAMFQQFQSDFAAPRYWIDLAAGRSRVIGPNNAAGALAYESYRLVHRRIAASTNERSMIAAVLSPPKFCGDTAQSVRNLLPPRITLLAVGLLNSFVVDWEIRKRITSHLDMHFVYALRVPRLIAGDPGFAEIVERSAKLICTTTEFDDLAKEAGLTPPDHTAGVTDPAGRAKLRAELDGIVAHLYGLTEPEFEHVLTTFPLVAPEVRNDALAEYRRLIETGEAARYNPDLPKPQAPAGPIIAPADQAVLDLIAAGESKSLEFKSTARFNVKANQPDPKMERIIAKTVAAFLNSNGGTLLIGVADDGSVRGLADDFAVLKKPDRDAFELWLMQMLMNDFEKDVAAQLHVSFHAIGPADSTDARPGAREVCRVDALPSPRPRFVKEDGQERFYVRTGNASNALSLKELLPYYHSRWPEGFSSSAPEATRAMPVEKPIPAPVAQASPPSPDATAPAVVAETWPSPAAEAIAAKTEPEPVPDARRELEIDTALEAGGEAETDTGDVDKPQPAKKPVPIEQTDRNEVMAVIRDVFNDWKSRSRDQAIADVAAAMGYRRVGQNIRQQLDDDLRTAVRRGILESAGGDLQLLAGVIDRYEREHLIHMLLAAMGFGKWWDREDAIRAAARHMGFRRTGSMIVETFKSAINGAIRREMLEGEGVRIRRLR